MRTIELSNDKARTLAGILARKWASLATRIAASTARVNTPFRSYGESMTTPSFLRRVASAKRDAKAIGEFLTALGADLPKVDRSQLVGPYKSPIVDGHKVVGWKPTKWEMAASGPSVQAERERIIGDILAQIK